MIRNVENLEDHSILPFLIHPLADARGQKHFWQNLIVNLSEKGDSQSTKEFLNVKIKRQLLHNYLKDICNLITQYEIYTIEISSPNSFYRKYIIQTDGLGFESSKVFTDYTKNIQQQNSYSEIQNF